MSAWPVLIAMGTLLGGVALLGRQKTAGAEEPVPPPEPKEPATPPPPSPSSDETFEDWERRLEELKAGISDVRTSFDKIIIDAAADPAFAASTRHVLETAGDALLDVDQRAGDALLDFARDFPNVTAADVDALREEIGWLFERDDLPDSPAVQWTEQWFGSP